MSADLRVRVHSSIESSVYQVEVLDAKGMVLGQLPASQVTLRLSASDRMAIVSIDLLVETADMETFARPKLTRPSHVAV